MSPHQLGRDGVEQQDRKTARYGQQMTTMSVSNRPAVLLRNVSEYPKILHEDVVDSKPILEPHSYLVTVKNDQTQFSCIYRCWRRKSIPD